MPLSLMSAEQRVHGFPLQCAWAAYLLHSPTMTSMYSLFPTAAVSLVACEGDERLPRASTCFNHLFLPTYSSAAVLEARLQQAIAGAHAFDEGAPCCHAVPRCAVPCCAVL